MAAEAVVAKQKPTKKRPSKGAAGGRGSKPKMSKEDRRKKYTDIAKKRRDKLNGRNGGGGNNSVCYNCRLPGHNAADCPSLGSKNNNKNNEPGGGVCIPVSGTVLCYKCGSTEHALKHCPKRHRGNRADLPYATCFVCNQKGHLASTCTKNTTGIYVNGGSCRRCGSTQHLATDCPERKKNKNRTNDDDDKAKNKDDDLLADLLEVDADPSSTISKTKQETYDKLNEKKSELVKPKKKKRVVNF